VAITRVNLEKRFEKKAKNLTGYYALIGNTLTPLDLVEDDSDIEPSCPCAVLDEGRSFLNIKKTKNGGARLVRNGGLLNDEHLGVLYHDKDGVYTFTLKSDDLTIGMAMFRDTENEKKFGIEDTLIRILPKKLFYKNEEEDETLPLLDFSVGVKK
jgi:hypothetical protein